MSPLVVSKDKQRHGVVLKVNLVPQNNRLLLTLTGCMLIIMFTIRKWTGTGGKILLYYLYIIKFTLYKGGVVYSRIGKTYL